MYRFPQLTTLFFLLITLPVFAARFNYYLLPEGGFPRVGTTDVDTFGPPNPPVECVALFGSPSALDCSFDIALVAAAEVTIRELNGESETISPYDDGYPLNTVWAHEIVQVRI